MQTGGGCFSLAIEAGFPLQSMAVMCMTYGEENRHLCTEQFVLAPRMSNIQALHLAYRADVTE